MGADDGEYYSVCLGRKPLIPIATACWPVIWDFHRARGESLRQWLHYSAPLIGIAGRKEKRLNEYSGRLIENRLYKEKRGGHIQRHRSTSRAFKAGARENKIGLNRAEKRGNLFRALWASGLHVPPPEATTLQLWREGQWHILTARTLRSSASQSHRGRRWGQVQKEHGLQDKKKREREREKKIKLIKHSWCIYFPVRPPADIEHDWNWTFWWDLQVEVVEWEHSLSSYRPLPVAYLRDIHGNGLTCLHECSWRPTLSIQTRWWNEERERSGLPAQLLLQPNVKANHLKLNLRSTSSYISYLSSFIPFFYFLRLRVLLRSAPLCLWAGTVPYCTFSLDDRRQN